MLGRLGVFPIQGVGHDGNEVLVLFGYLEFGRIESDCVVDFHEARLVFVYSDLLDVGLAVGGFICDLGVYGVVDVFVY